MLASRGATRRVRLQGDRGQWERVTEKMGGLYEGHPQGEAQIEFAIGKSHSVISNYLDPNSVSVWMEMYVNVNVSTCTRRAHPASHVYNHLASTTLVPGSTVTQTDVTLLMSSHNFLVQPILPSLMPAGNAKQGAAEPGPKAPTPHPHPCSRRESGLYQSPGSHQPCSPLHFQGLLCFFPMSNFPGLSLARLASSHKADVRFETAAPGELSYVVLCQGPALWWL